MPLTVTRNGFRPAGIRPVRVLECGAMRLRPLTEAECYARCYGGFRTDQVTLLDPGAAESDRERVAIARLRELAAQRDERPEAA
jgi:hypothetical protein